jgi:glucose/arabinose dehydrogenase
MKNHFVILLLLPFCSLVSTNIWASKARIQALQGDHFPVPSDESDLLRFPASNSGFPKVVQKKTNLPLSLLKLPPGFGISIFAVVPEARSLALGQKGEVFVGTRTSKVYRVRDPKLTGTAESVEIIKDGLEQPNGVAYKDGDLYVAEISQITRYKNISQKTAKNLKAEILPQKFPKDTHHGWKFIRFGPDGWLYVPVGANCNVCDPGKDYARLYRVDVKSDKKELVAQGIRNTVGFDWDPKSQELWFTDNGRDLMGDDVPPDEINKVSKNAEHFGFPYCHGKAVQDPQFKKPCIDFTPAQADLPAHVAALGMRFYTGKMFPREFHNQILIAEHGSWNRSIPQGYRLSQVSIKEGSALFYKPWIEGWLPGQKSGEIWGRPVDVEVYFDGSLLISDDQAGVIYRLSYQEPKK